MKICLVASTGGHLSQLYHLREAFQNYETRWITFPLEDAQSLLKNEEVIWAYHPTDRNLLNLVRNAWLAWRLLRREKPDVIISTGAGVGVPFVWMGCLLNITTIFIESITFSDKRSLSGKLVYPLVDHYYVQWPDLARKYSRAVYKGQVL